MTNNPIPYSCSVGEDEPRCFELLTSEEKQLIDANKVDVSYKKGEIICKQGTFATHIMVVTEGLAKIFLEGCNDSLILKILPAVNIIGLPCLFEGNSIFHYSAQAYLDTTVSLIEIGTFKKIIESNAKFASKIISLLGENTIIAYGRFFCLTKKQTNGRLADVLLCLSQRIYKDTNFPLHLTRKELAELAGMSVESTTRILTKFNEEGLIRINKKNIEIVDLDRLILISLKG